MISLEIKEIIEKINSLVNNQPYLYLENKSTWFSDNFVDINDNNRYPYINLSDCDYFHDKNVKKFEKEVALKFLINNDLNNNDVDDLKVALWVIKIWGGIKGIKETSIQKILINLENKIYPFENISSWSKVHSFKNIKSDVIYDSRVIYSLNWLLLSLNIDTKFFLQPEGRNKKLSTFPVSSIINFKNSKFIDVNKKGDKTFEKVYFKGDELYSKYIEIITAINENIWKDEYIDLSKFNGQKIYLKDYNFFTELLLFNMADDVILEDLRKNLFIALKC